jgi:GNAT superfamily N-acetyltransferase
MQVVVRRVVEDDWQLLRAVRLEMLTDTPDAYLERLADAEPRTEEEWRFRSDRGSSGPTNLALAAEDPDRPDRWVAGRMLDAVAEWARGEAALDRLHLHVHEDNARAQAFYRRYGFTETGGSFPYDLDPTKSELEMALLLDPQQP